MFNTSPFGNASSPLQQVSNTAPAPIPTPTQQPVYGAEQWVDGIVGGTPIPGGITESWQLNGGLERFNQQQAGLQKEMAYDAANPGPELKLVQGPDGNWTNANADANQAWVKTKLETLYPQTNSVEYQTAQPAAFWGNGQPAAQTGQQTPPQPYPNPTELWQVRANEAAKTGQDPSQQAQNDFWAIANAPIIRADAVAPDTSMGSMYDRGIQQLGLQQDAQGNWFNPNSTAPTSSNPNQSAIDQWLAAHPNGPETDADYAAFNALHGVAPAAAPITPEPVQSPAQDPLASGTYKGTPEEQAARAEWLAGYDQRMEPWRNQHLKSLGISDELIAQLPTDWYNKSGKDIGSVASYLMSTQDPTFKYADNMPGLAPAPTNYYDEYLKNFEASLNPEYDRSGNRQAASTAARTTGLKGLYEYIMNPNGQYTADQAGAFFQELLGGLSDNTYASNRAQQANGYYGVTNDAWAASEAERNTLLQKAFGVDPTDILAQARQNSNNRALTQEGLTGAINANRQLYSSLLSNVSDPTKLDKSALQQLFQMAGLGTQQQSALSKMQAQKYDATQAAKQQALQQQNTQNLLNSYAKSSGISSPLTAMSFG